MRPDRAIRTTHPHVAAWTEEVRARLDRGDPVGAVDVVVERAPKRKGQPGVVGVHSAAVTELVAAAAGSALVQRDWALRLTVQLETTHRSVGAALLPPLWASYPRDVERAIAALAECEDWVTREDAATALGAVFDAHFREVLPRAREWIGGRSSRLRRATILAAKHAALGRDRSREQDLLDLLEPALRDADPYVRKSLGAFAIGDGLLRAYPDAALARLERWAGDADENVRWNVAMAFAAAQAAPHVERALAILAPLAADERKNVWRAVASALGNLARRRPAETRATLFAWLEDPARRHAAEAAMAAAPSVRV